MNLGDYAQAYEPPQMQNISELKRIPLNIEVVEETHKDNDGKDFTGLYFTLDGKKWKMPYMALQQIKVIKQEQPNVKFIKVVRSGQGMSTRYMVMPVVE